MALTRKLLSALGIEADKIDEIITAHTDTVDALTRQKNDLKAKADKYDELKTAYDALKATSEGSDTYKDKYDELKQQFDEYKTEQASKEAERQKQAAYRDLLRQAGIPDKRLDLIMKVTDLSNAKIKGGKLEDQDKLKQKIKEDWADFIPEDQSTGASTSTPPDVGTPTGTMTKKEIMAIKDPQERQKAIAENHELFNF